MENNWFMIVNFSIIVLYIGKILSRIILQLKKYKLLLLLLKELYIVYWICIITMSKHIVYLLWND